MLHATRIVSPHSSERNLLAALCLLFSLKAVYIALVVGASAAALLFVLSLLLDALLEITHHVAEIWLASNSIEKLLMFVVAWMFFYKCSPMIARVCHHCRRMF